jgi:hypothetical protein
LAIVTPPSWRKYRGHLALRSSSAKGTTVPYESQLNCLEYITVIAITKEWFKEKEENKEGTPPGKAGPGIQ